MTSTHLPDTKIDPCPKYFAEAKDSAKMNPDFG